MPKLTEDDDDDLLDTDINYRRLWRDWMSKHQLLIYVGFALMVVNAVATAGYSKIIQLIIAAYETADPSVIYWGPIGIIVLSVAKAVSTYLRDLSTNLALARFETDLRKALYNKLLYADLSRLQAKSPSAYAVRLMSDVQLLSGAIQKMMGGISSILVITITIGVMLSIDWQITLMLVVVFAAAVFPVNIIGMRVKRITKESQGMQGTMNRDVTEGLSGIRMARTYQIEEHLEKTAKEVFNGLFVRSLKIKKWKARVSPIMEILSGLAIAALLVVVSWRIQNDTIMVADFMGLLTAVGIIAQPARKLGTTFTGAVQGTVALRRMFTILDAENTIFDHENAKEITSSEGHLVFENVRFKYPNGFKALSNINIDIPAGSKVALVGRSGAGKSTIFNLIPRLFDPSGGRILLDGVDIRDITIKSLRNQIAVVNQDSVLLRGTVAENIRFGRVDASDEEIRAAAIAAEADGFIQNLNQGYDTEISPSGVNFSGGEKQRLSIARSILRDASIFLLDEPTSALDAESEVAIKHALDEMSEGRTTITIAHRLATILDADMIIVMDSGFISEIGTHQELMKAGRLYAEFYRLQFADMA